MHTEQTDLLKAHPKIKLSVLLITSFTCTLSRPTYTCISIAHASEIRSISTTLHHKQTQSLHTHTTIYYTATYIGTYHLTHIQCTMAFLPHSTCTQPTFCVLAATQSSSKDKILCSSVLLITSFTCTLNRMTY